MKRASERKKNILKPLKTIFSLILIVLNMRSIFLREAKLKKIILSTYDEYYETKEINYEKLRSKVSWLR